MLNSVLRRTARHCWSNTAAGTVALKQGGGLVGWRGELGNLGSFTGGVGEMAPSSVMPFSLLSTTCRQFAIPRHLRNFARKENPDFDYNAWEFEFAQSISIVKEMTEKRQKLERSELTTIKNLIKEFLDSNCTQFDIIVDLFGSGYIP